MGLSSEFNLPIAHSIRQQILEHQKTLQTNKRSNYMRSMMYPDEEDQFQGYKIRLCETPLFIESGAKNKFNQSKYTELIKFLN